MDSPGPQPERTEVVTRARRLAVRTTRVLGRDDLAHDAALVAGELVTNALLHGGGCAGVDVRPMADGVRIEVRDRNRVPPVLSRPGEASLTGRGLRFVAALATRWGASREPGGKVVWAEVTGAERAGRSPEPLVWTGEDDTGELDAEPRFRVELGDVPTDLLLAAKSHVDNVLRELELASAGAEAGLTAELPRHLASLLAAVDRFAPTRLAVKYQALQADRRGEATTRLTLDLPAGAADDAEAYIAALDGIDGYCRAMRMLTLETPPQHRLFRTWYVCELVGQLRAKAAGEVAPPVQPFERRVLAELDRLASAQRAAERMAKLYAVAVALASAASPEAVAHAVLTEGAGVLGAAGGGVLLATSGDHLSLPGAIGYDEAVVARLRAERRDAELPAAEALRTGEPVWLESLEERDRRFPELAGMEATTVSLCAVPLAVEGRRLGALQFSFNEARLFDEDERRFILALAAQSAQALGRAELQRQRLDVSRRLQRSLLPPALPSIPRLDVAALYHPFGTGIDVGGDFYDLWQIGPDRWAITIGDAAGTGPEAAAVTARVRHTMRALTMTESDPVAVMESVNRALLAAADDNDEARFCTALFGVLTVGDGIELTVASGGHPPPLVRRGTGDIERVPLAGGLLGLFPDVEFGNVTLELGPADTVLLLTDGVVEARRGGALFELAGVRRVLKGDLPSAQAVADALRAAVLAHVGGSLGDDMAAVVLRVTAGA